MLITNIRYGRTKNLGNYESEKLEVEIIPEAGQTAEAALDEVRGYVDGKMDVQPNGKPAPPTNGKKPVATATKEPVAPLATEETKPLRRGRRPTHEKDLQSAMDSDSLEVLLERFNIVRQAAKKFGVDSWEQGVGELARRYRELNSPDANPETQSQLIAAFKSERNYLDEAKVAA